MKHDHVSPNELPDECSCCCSAGHESILQASLSRRHVLFGVGAATAAPWAFGSSGAQTKSGEDAAARAAVAAADELVVQPVLLYRIYERKERTSWRGWGIENQSQVDQEVKRIDGELREVATAGNLALRLLPVIAVATPEQLQKAGQVACDVLLVYPACVLAAPAGTKDGYAMMETLFNKDRSTIFFLRHESGLFSYWSFRLVPNLLSRKTDTNDPLCGFGPEDVVVDSHDDLEWRLRSLLALRRVMGQRIVAIGTTPGPRTAVAQEKWRLDIRPVSYPQLEERIKKLRATPSAASAAAKQAAQYLADPDVKLLTDRRYVENAFLLRRSFLDLMQEHSARAITVQNCMTVIMPIADTSACLVLSALNDDGYQAFCEGDFTVIPAGMLMNQISRTPCFLQDLTFAHHGKVAVAHCTSPRKMDGKSLEPVEIPTHYESDFGAAAKVTYRKGQVITMVCPDRSSLNWLGFRGTVTDSPAYAICRSQCEVAVEGDWERLVQAHSGIHWMMVYGDIRNEVGYAIRRLGIAWEDISSPRRSLI